MLDYCLHQGSENVVIYFRDNVYIIKTLKEFQYIDEEGKDQGANVRQKAKDITSLLIDEGRLRQERRARASMRDRMIRGGAGEVDETDPTVDDDENLRRRSGTGRKSNKDEDDLKKAIEESKRSLAKDQQTAEERDLQEALRLSREEEEKHKNAVENSNAAALFDDQNQLYVLLVYFLASMLSFTTVLPRTSSTTIPSRPCQTRHHIPWDCSHSSRNNCSLNLPRCSPSSRRSIRINSRPSKRYVLAHVLTVTYTFAGGILASAAATAISDAAAGSQRRVDASTATFTTTATTDAAATAAEHVYAATATTNSSANWIWVRSSVF